MRRRSISWKYVGSGFAVMALALVFFTRIFIPLERAALDIVGAFLLGYHNAMEGGNAVFTSPAEKDEAHIVGKRFDEFRDVLLVEGTYRDGAAVFAGESLVGFIIESGSRTSKVRAIISPGVRTPGVLERSGIPVELEGKGAEFLEMTLPRGSDVATGDVVRSADQMATEGRLSMIGSVVRIDDNDSEPFLRILVRSSVTITSLFTVSVHDL